MYWSTFHVIVPPWPILVSEHKAPFCTKNNNKSTKSQHSLKYYMNLLKWCTWTKNTLNYNLQFTTKTRTNWVNVNICHINVLRIEEIKSNLTLMTNPIQCHPIGKHANISRLISPPKSTNSNIHGLDLITWEYKNTNNI